MTTSLSLSSSASVANVAQQLTDQYRVVENAKNSMLRESIKFGTMLIQWEQFLGCSKAGPGRGHSGEGLKGWLADNCPEINYNSAKVYKSLAAKTVKMLGGGAMAIAALQDAESVSDPDGQTIDVDAEIIGRRDALFEEAQSRRQLEQMWFSFSAEASKGHAGRPVGSVAEYKKLTPVECAVKVTWPLVDHMMKHRGELFHAYQILPEDKLGEMLSTLDEQCAAIRAELKQRKA